MLTMNILVFILLYLSLDYGSCHIVSWPQSKVPKSNRPDDACHSANSASLVENFFNLIFTEFHSQPPVCVCVQMCVDQPTYCYPNGCFKKVDNTVSNSNNKINKPPTYLPQVSQVQSDKNQPMSFLIDDQSNFMDNLLKNKLVAESKPGPTEQNTFKEVYRDQFKDRYQSLFKYKKTPKVHLRYNLREQVKHMKSDVIKIQKLDVSKTKWPVTENKQFFLEIPNPQKPPDYNKYNPNVAFNNGPMQYQSKFFKRDVGQKYVPKSENLEYDKTQDNSTFSLETFIENMIVGSFGPLQNGSEIDFNVDVNYSVNDQNATTVEPITIPYKRNAIENNSSTILNETTNVVSINHKNQNLDENKYTGDTKEQLYKNVFNEMIASLSKHIDKNNNSSIEMMEHVMGHRVFDTTERLETLFTTPRELKIDITMSSIEEYVENTTEKPTTDSTQSYVENSTVHSSGVVKKSHQRLTRKLLNSKTN